MITGTVISIIRYMVPPMSRYPARTDSGIPARERPRRWRGARHRLKFRRRVGMPEQPGLLAVVDRQRNGQWIKPRPEDSFPRDPIELELDRRRAGGVLRSDRR